MTAALQVAAALWPRNATPWQGVDLQTQAIDWGAKHNAVVRRQKLRQLSRQSALKAGIVSQCRANSKYARSDVVAWRIDLSESEDAPRDAQCTVIDHATQRSQQDYQDLGQAGALVAQKMRSLSEPPRARLFGIPGAIKSPFVKLGRRFFE